MRKSNFKYHLRPGSKKDRCPSCGHYRCFVPYVDVNGVPAGEQFGRCERINSCGYIKYPKDGITDYSPIRTAPVLIKEPDYIDERIVKSTLGGYMENGLLRYISALFNYKIAVHVAEKYNIGTYGRYTIFWQQDKDGRFRTGKAIAYEAGGHRSKSIPAWYVHKKASGKEDFNLVQVFFGEHLLTGSAKPVALVESEKTAVLMSIVRPDYTWLAAGGAEMLNTYRLSRLPRLDIIYPDNGQRIKWTAKTAYLHPNVDLSVDKAVASGKLEAGADIADLVFNQLYNNRV